MHLILVLVGAVLAFAGALLVLYAVPVIDAAAAALFTSGIFAIVGALILFALAVVARGIDRIAERLEVQPLSGPSVPPVVTVTREDIAPRPARAEPAPAAMAPPPEPAGRALPKRPSVLSSWLNRASPAANGMKPPAVVQVASEPPALAADAAPPPDIPDEPPPPPPLVAPAPVEPTIAAPPIVAAPPPPPPPPPPPAPAAPIIPRVVTPAARPVPPTAASPATTVYKSGVIDGMAYTLFMDGAIEAELPQGRVRFASVDELQKYLTNRS